jgi:hypothetical protein
MLLGQRDRKLVLRRQRDGLGKKKLGFLLRGAGNLPNLDTSGDDDLGGGHFLQAPFVWLSVCCRCEYNIAGYSGNVKQYF